MKELKQLSLAFKALSNPHRLELYLKIKEHEAFDIDQVEKRPCFISNICRNWKLGAPTISHHLKELVNAKLVEADKEGKYMTCSLNERTLAHLRDILD